MTALPFVSRFCDTRGYKPCLVPLIPLAYVASFKVLDRLPMEMVGPYGEYIGLPFVAVMMLQLSRRVFDRGGFLFHRTAPDDCVKQEHKEEWCSHYLYTEELQTLMDKMPKS